MLIDWFTVGAQVLNFLVLIWLLKLFLYQPILNAIDDREQRIARELAEATAKQAAAAQERDEFHRKNAEFDQQRSLLLIDATKDANAERQRLFDVARKDADAELERRRVALEREKLRLSDQIIRRTWDEVFAIARKSLTDLAGMSLEQRMIDVFVVRLRELTPDGKAAIHKAIDSSSGSVLIRSAFDFDTEQRVNLQGALNQTLAAEVPLRFELEPQLISGIELTAGGQKLAWCIADYVARLETMVHDRPSEQLSSVDQTPLKEVNSEPRIAAVVEAR